MADTTYQPNVYMKQGGDTLVVASGGSIDVESGGDMDVQSAGTITVASGGLINMLGILAAGTATTKASTIADPSGGSTSTGGTVTTGGIDSKARTAIIAIITALDGVKITATA